MGEPTSSDSRPARPLPVGAFPLPFGYLLLPGVAEAAPVRAGLLVGRLPTAWPDALRGHERALAGDLSGAREAFAGDDPVSRFNRLVIDPASVDPAQLRADLGHDLAPLVDVVLFTLGESDALPGVDDLDGECRALLLSAYAARAVQAEEASEAIRLLEDAVACVPEEYPALGGVMHGALGFLCQQAGAIEQAIDSLQRGLSLLAGTDLDVALAEQHLQLASIYQEQAGSRRDLLAKAVHHYHCAVQAVTEHQSPELFAAAHANLATAYLTMPMVEASDQLRFGVAVGSLRAALRVYTPATHPQQWASAQLNLANALVYAPATRRADNLVEAVEAYEAVLAVRNRTNDPLGYARVLANQGNALAHLGLFDQAWGKLVEARFLFEEFHEYDAVTSVRGVLDEIARQRSATGTGG
ncbi:MAG: hypothetical protein ACYCU5_03565 [Actinomycetes bacterium]